MLNKLFKTFGNRNASPSTTQPAAIELKILERSEHHISRKQISKNALSVLYELNRAGFEAYLVGGCIRDLFLYKSPKDFDVATDATPEQVSQLFKRSRIVGRRFKIVHVRYGREIIEVTTFRAAHSEGQQSSTKHDHRSDEGMLLRDNVYGSMQDDAIRRDFTINALYYSVDGFKVFDYTNGLQDLKEKVIRIIGDAEQRYREDPVRMLRAVRFAAKLGFSIEEKTAAPIKQLHMLMSHIPPARLFDEVIKLFLQGNAVKTFELIMHYRLLHALLPTAAAHFEDQQTTYYKLLIEALSNTDQRIAQKKSVTPAFMFASLLWSDFSETLSQLEASGTPRWRAAQIAGHQTIDKQQSTISIPKRFSIAIREIWTLQHNLETSKGSRALKLLHHPRFRAAYDFLLIRERSNDPQACNSEFWTELQKDNAIPASTHDSEKKHPRKRSRHSNTQHRQNTNHKSDT